jgi:hypothetical protein
LFDFPSLAHGRVLGGLHGMLLRWSRPVCGRSGADPELTDASTLRELSEVPLPQGLP